MKKILLTLAILAGLSVPASSQVIGPGPIQSQSGFYTPTITSVANIDATTAYSCQWIRVTNVVTVSCRVDIDATTAATGTSIGISLPVPSTGLSAANQVAGVGAVSNVGFGGAGSISADTVNKRAQFDFTSGAATTNAGWFLTFTYRIL